MKGREGKGREEMRMEAKTSERAESESDGVKKEQELDLSGMSLDSLPNPSINLGTITKLDLSNNNLQVSSSCTHRTALHLMKLIVFLVSEARYIRKLFSFSDQFGFGLQIRVHASTFLVVFLFPFPEFGRK